MGLAVGMEYPVKAALRADIQTLIGQGWHDLTWRQRGVLRLVAGEQDALALLFGQLVRDQPMTAFAAIAAFAITKICLAPAFERAQADADLAAGTDQACASSMRLADQLDRLAPVNSAGQPSASSEQKASHFFASPATPPSLPWPSPCAAAPS
jgi:hypothetical protein